MKSSNKKWWIIGLIVLFLIGRFILMQITAEVGEKERVTVSSTSNAIHQSLPFVSDLHADPLMHAKDLTKSKRLHVNLTKMREGNVALQVFGIPTKSNIPNMDSNKEPKVNILSIAFPQMLFKNAYQKAEYQIRKLEKLENKDDKFHFIKSKDDLKELLELRKEDSDHVGGMVCIEGIHCIGEDLSKVDELYQKGLRIIGLAHFFDNPYTGSQSGFEKYGLTEKGKQLLHKMDSLGMIIDLAHSSMPTIDSVLKYYPKPPIISHVGSTSIHESTRNLDDNYLKKIMDAGGVVGVMFFNPLCYHPFDKNENSSDDIVNTILHLIKLNGGKANGIALGSDYDGTPRVPFDISDLSIITHKLLEAEVSEESIQMIMGGNVRDYFLEYL